MKSRTVTSTYTTHGQQKSLSLDLHQLSPLWSEVRRRIVSAKDAARQMINHPFFAASGGVKSIESYLNKIIYTFDDLQKRTEELDSNTNILINLVSSPSLSIGIGQEFSLPTCGHSDQKLGIIKIC